MPVSAVAACPRCQSAFPGALCNTPTPVRCPACEATVLIELYPAYFQTSAVGAMAEPVLEEGISSCFYHEGKKAVTHCGACGRFVCALCDLDMGDRHVCPQCLQAAPRKGAPPSVDNSRTLFDGMALQLALLSIVPMLHLMTAPGAICLGIFSFFRPPSLVGHTKILAVVAIVLATLLGVVWTWWMFQSDFWE